MLGILTYISVTPAYVNDKKEVLQYLVAEEREPRIHGDINNPWGG
ncbi:hypothetical protein M2349_002383 [Caldanaerobacter subterraneus subsp. tengcongensis MB4]|nr:MULTISPECIES: hypothetical protein [Thermoanaerobacteraceae]ABY92653.1 hypothetical protein Teth514_1363 [Thermoanaerobacter sp. X514]MCS3917242.1 hypothetical protein [Caldanaerobacter subterraneus subsp. tengcongensis MB4]